MNAIQTKVAEQLAKISEGVQNDVVSVMVDRELKKRSDALVVVLDMLADLENQLKKLSKPDNVFYNEDGSEAASTFSKVRTEERKKLKEKIAKYEKAIEKALAGDMGDVYNLKNQGKGGSGSKEETDQPSD